MSRHGQAQVMTVLLLATLLSGCGESGGNKLIGTWRLTPGGHCMVDRITFTKGNVINHDGPDSYYAGQESTVPVYYLIDGANRVTATSRDHATSVTYVLSDDDHMSMGDNPGCAFERAS
jgi:hypothetical protein